MTVHYYHSGQAGAPTLTGQAGSLVNLLDKCLVDGFGSEAPAGWSIAFTGTDKRAYRSNESGGLRHYYRVLNDGSVAGGANYAYVRGYHTMSDVDTGGDPYPSVAQRSHGVTWAPSSVADSSTRPWAVIADGQCCLAFFQSASDVRCSANGFGDFEPALPSDVGHGFVFGASTDGAADAADVVLNRDVVALSTQAGGFIASSLDGSVISIQAGVGTPGRVTTGNFGVVGPAYPNPHIVGPVLLPVLIHDSAGRRGVIRYLMAPEHSSASYPGNGDVVVGVDGHQYAWRRVWGQVAPATAHAALLTRID